MSHPEQTAADIAAQEVEAIVKAAQAAAEHIKQSARTEIAELRRTVIHETEEIRAGAKKEAEGELEAARAKAIQLGSDARKEAELRVAEAQKAADEVLEEARAVSNGLRQLAATLTEQAGRILREVQAGHRRMTADLRAPARGGVSSTSGASTRRAAAEPVGDNPFADLEVPGWLGS